MANAEILQPISPSGTLEVLLLPVLPKCYLMVHLESFKEHPAQTTEISQKTKNAFCFPRRDIHICSFHWRVFAMVHYQVLNDKLCCQKQTANNKNINGIPHMFSIEPTQSSNMCHMKHHWWKENPNTKSIDISVKCSFLTSFDFRYISTPRIWGLWKQKWGAFSVSYKTHGY